MTADPTLAWTLFETAHDSALGSESVVQLEQLLRGAASEISDHDLAALALLELVTQAHYYDDSIGSGGTIQGYVDVDCATVRGLAADEIARRGRPPSSLAVLATIVGSTMDITVRIWAVRTLGESGDPNALPILRTAARTGHHLGAAATAAIASLEDHLRRR